MALLAAVFHGTWNILVKVSGDPITTLRRATVMAAIVATLALAPAWLLFGRPNVAPGGLLFAVVSSVLETTYLWLLSAAYRRGELSAVYPIARGSAPLLSVMVGLALLGEGLAPRPLVGVALLPYGIPPVPHSETPRHPDPPAVAQGGPRAAYT